MGRSICYAEPKSAKAGQSGTWKFIYTAGNSLPKGTLLKFDLLTKGRAIDWEVAQAGQRVKKNGIWLELPDGKSLPAKSLKNLGEFEFTLPAKIPEGEELKIVIGSPSDDASKGNTAQRTIQRRRPFHLYIDTKGKGDYKEMETFTLDIRGNVLTNIRIVAPSLVTKNQRFDIIVRFEDSYGNLTGNAPEGTLIELCYDQLRENINWKLFVPETGFINLPNLYFNESGVYRLTLKNLSTNEIYDSPPIKCTSSSPTHIFWGTFHGESEIYDAQENIESCLRNTRDDKAYQFYAVSPFEEEKETNADMWKLIGTHVADFNEDDRFSTFLGMQWAGDEGLRQIVYSKDNKPLLRKKDAKSNTVKKIYKSHTPKELMGIPSFTMGSKSTYNFEDFSPEYEHVVEIYNAWGCSECPESEGNLRPIKAKSKKGMREKKEGSLRAALAKNVRFGFVAGGLDDRGIFADLFDTDQEQYTPGLTAILSPTQTRDALFQAIKIRSCYATTGARIIVGFSIAEESMGSMLSTTTKPGLAYNRHIEGYVVGTDTIKHIEVIRNGEIIKTFTPNESTYHLEFDDMNPIEESLFPSMEDKPPFTYYYLRIIQKDSHLAWSSPIWIDAPEYEPVKGKKKK